jgi:hypothetical protein
MRHWLKALALLPLLVLAAPAGAAPLDTTAPDVTGFQITRNPFRVGGLGTVIKWSQSEAGNHALRFRGRFDLKHPLRPGRWRMTLTARDAAGNASSPDRVRFRLLPEKRG